MRNAIHIDIVELKDIECTADISSISNPFPPKSKLFIVPIKNYANENIERTDDISSISLNNNVIRVTVINTDRHIEECYTYRHSRVKRYRVYS